MNYALPGGWDEDRRGFWTQRKRTTTGLLTVLALISGLAVAFKLFDSAVPNNVVRDSATFDFEVWKLDQELGEQEFVNTAEGRAVFEPGVDHFPGDTRTVDVKVVNTNEQPAKDATIFAYIDPETIAITGCHDADGNATPVIEHEDGSLECAEGSTTATPTSISPTGSTADAWSRFANFWTLGVDKQRIYQAGPAEVNHSDHTGQNHLQSGGNPDDSGNRAYDDACSGPLTSINRDDPCNLGLVRERGARDALGEALDSRYYLFHLTEFDDSDQSPFKGWTLTFSIVFQARVPALPETGIQR